MDRYGVLFVNHRFGNADTFWTPGVGLTAYSEETARKQAAHLTKNAATGYGYVVVPLPQYE